MSNHYTLTKPVEIDPLVTELRSAGVTLGINIYGDTLELHDPNDPPTLASQMAIVATVVTAHVSTITTEVPNVLDPPHVVALTKAIEALGATGVAVQVPASYPGTVVVQHNPANSGIRSSITATVLSHNAATRPFLSVSVSSIVVPADGSTQDTVTISDSRGAAASGLTVKIIIPAGSSPTMDADSYTLDAAGQAEITFGSTSDPTGDIEIVICYTSDEADAVKLTVRRGTP